MPLLKKSVENARLLEEMVLLELSVKTENINNAKVDLCCALINAML